MASIGDESIGTAPGDREDRGYADLLVRIQERFAANAAAGPIFTTDAAGLDDAYLDHLADRQEHTCHACRRFLEVYGGLVVIGEDGRAAPAIWDEADAPPYYRAAVAAMARVVRKARVTGVFLSTAPAWGRPVTGPWTHFAVTPPESMVYRPKLLTAGRAMAEKRGDFGNVIRALAEFNPSTVNQAVRLLDSEALYRSEKVGGPARWLKGLHEARHAARGDARENLVWRAVATAPAGFCHPRSSMVGTLLEDIAGGMAFPEVSRRFAAKMHPLQYQRPTAPPSAGNIADAEKVVEQLGIARSLERRFARLEEVEAIWTPREAPDQAAPAGGGVFAHLRPKGAGPSASPLQIPTSTMTWEKFARTVLPTAEGIEYFAKNRLESYTALVTAAHADAPPILQWDRTDRRNPVSWYVYSGGSLPGQWGLKAGNYHKVTAVAMSPWEWGGNPSKVSNQGQGVLFLLEGARDHQEPGLALFPETLKSELHAIRKTIEAFSARGRIEGREEASACGILLARGGSWDATFRVHAAGESRDYRLDRWD